MVALKDQSAFESTLKQPAQSSISSEEIKFAYCTEFIINKYNAKTTADKMRAAIEPKGDCMIVIDEDDIVKVYDWGLAHWVFPVERQLDQSMDGYAHLSQELADHLSELFMNAE